MWGAIYISAPLLLFNTAFQALPISIVTGLPLAVSLTPKGHPLEYDVPFLIQAVY